MMPLRVVPSPLSSQAFRLAASLCLLLIACGASPGSSATNPFHREAEPERNRDWPAERHGGFVNDPDGTDIVGDDDETDGSDQDYGDESAYDDESGDYDTGDYGDDYDESDYGDYGDDDSDFGDDDGYE